MTALGDAVRYLRLRRAGSAWLIAATISLSMAWYWTASVQIPFQDTAVPVRLTLLAPLAVAAVLGVASGDPVPDAARTSARRLWLPDAAYLLAQPLLLALLLGTAGGMAGDLDSAAPAVRNAVGLHGLALAGASGWGAGLSWLLPAGLTVVTLLAGVPAGGTSAPWWAWLLDAPTQQSWLIAALLSAAGMGLAVVRRPR